MQATDWLVRMRCDKQNHMALMTSLEGGIPREYPIEYINRVGQRSR